MTLSRHDARRDGIEQERPVRSDNTFSFSVQEEEED